MELDLNPVLTPVLTPVRDLGEFIREQRLAAQISVRALAAKAGVSNPYLSQVERGLRRPSAEILAQIAHGLSISVETMLAKAGILESSEAPEVVTAIRADPVLTERQKAVLLDIYAALRKETQALIDRPAPAAGPIPGPADAGVRDPAGSVTVRTVETTPEAAPETTSATDPDAVPETATGARSAAATGTARATGSAPVDPPARRSTPTGITSVPEGEHHAAV